MSYPKFDTKNATEDFSSVVSSYDIKSHIPSNNHQVDEMTTAAQLKPGKANMSAPLPPSSSASTSAPPVSTVTPVEEHSGPVGSKFLIDDSPLDYSEMRTWSEYEVSQFDAAQTLFPSAGQYTACGSSYSAYDFIQEAVGILSAKYTAPQKMAICDGIGRYYEHFLVDLGAPAPFQWKHVKGDASLIEKVSQFLEVFAKLTREQTRTAYPLDTKKSIHGAAKALLQLYSQSEKIQPTAMQFSSSPTAIPSPDAWKFSSPVTSPTGNPFNLSSSPPTGGLSGSLKPWELVTPTSISTFAPVEDTTSSLAQSFSNIFGTNHTIHGNIWDKLSKSQSTGDDAEIVKDDKAQSISFEDRTEAYLDQRSKYAPQNLSLHNAAFQPNNDELLPKMQELRNLELNLELIESCCVEKDALLGGMVLSPNSITVATSKNTLFDAELTSLTPFELSKHLDTRIQLLKLDIASAQLLLDQKCTRLALLESGADSLSQNRNAHGVAQEVMELRVQKLKGRIRYIESYQTLTGQNDGRMPALSYEAILESGLSIRKKPNEQIADNIFRSICSEDPVQWTSSNHATSDPENGIEPKPKNSTHNNVAESDALGLQVDQTEVSENQENVPCDTSDLVYGHEELDDAISEDLGGKSLENEKQLEMQEQVISAQAKQAVRLNVEVDGTDQETRASATVGSDDENTATGEFQLSNDDSQSDDIEDENTSSILAASKGTDALTNASLGSSENLNTHVNQVLASGTDSSKSLEGQ